MIETMASQLRPRRARRGLPADLRLGDVVTFFAVHRSGSVTGAARALGTSASNVSKALSRLEGQLGLVLLSRGAHGVTVTDDALRVLPDLEKVAEHLQRVVTADRAGEARALTLAGPAYLVQLLLPAIASALPRLRWSGLQLTPAKLRALAAENRFDVALVAGRADLPRGWDQRPIGELRRALFARPSLAASLGDPPVPVERVRAVPFVTPVQGLDGRFAQGDDDCPLGVNERRLGHRVETIQLALELAAETDQVVFGPVIAARRHLDDGRLVAVDVAGWRSIETLALACNSERVLASELGAIVDVVRRRLAALDGAAG